MGSPAELGRQVLLEVQTSLGDDWSTLTDEQKNSIEETATMLMAKQFELAAETDPVKKKDIQEQILALESIVTDWKVWGAFAIEEAFWRGVQKVAAAIGTFLAAFADEAISRIVPGL